MSRHFSRESNVSHLFMFIRLSLEHSRCFKTNMSGCGGQLIEGNVVSTQAAHHRREEVLTCTTLVIVVRKVTDPSGRTSKWYCCHLFMSESQSKVQAMFQEMFFEPK